MQSAAASRNPALMSGDRKVFLGSFERIKTNTPDRAVAIQATDGEKRKERKKIGRAVSHDGAKKRPQSTEKMQHTRAVITAPFTPKPEQMLTDSAAGNNANES